MPAATLPLDASVEAVLAYDAEILTSAEAARLVRRDPSHISHACKRQKIEAHGSCVRGRGSRSRWTFSKAAFIAWIWDNTTGDKKLLKATLAAKAPHLLALLEAPADEREALPAELPSNVLDITTGTKAKPRAARAKQAAHPAGTGLSQPDLFSLTAS